MAIENTYLLGKNITLGCGFDLQAKAPLDSRQTVPAFAGLQALINGDAAYEGMIVYDEETKKTYQAQKCDPYTVTVGEGEDAKEKTYSIAFREFGINEAELKDLIASETTAAMEFKGVATALPENPAKGDFYKVTASFKVGEEDAKVGDSIVYDGAQWFIIPSGDDIEDTWRPVTDVDNDVALTFAAGDKIDVAVASNGTITYSHEVIDAPTATPVGEDEQTRTYITSVETDGYGHITGYKTATETVEDTNTEYTFEGQSDETTNVYFQVKASDAEAAEVIYLNAYSKNEADGKFVAKEEGKSLVSDDEIARLANVDNYNDEEVRGLIGDNAKAIEDLAEYVGTVPTDDKYKDLSVVAYINKKAEETLAAAQGGSSETAASVKQQLDNYKSENDTRVKAVEDDIDAINNADTGILKQAKDYADGLAGNYDEAGAAAGVKTYVDEELAKKVDTATYTADKATFATKTELGDVDKKFADYRTSADQDNIDNGHKERIEALEAKFTGDNSVDAKIAAAVDTEKQRAEGIEGGLRTDVNAVAGRMTTAEGKITALEGASATHATKDELNAVDAKFADYTKTADLPTDLGDFTNNAGYAKTTDVNTELDKKADKTQVATDIANAIAPLATTEALNGVKATADAAAVATEVEAALALKADKSVVDAMYTNTQIDGFVQGAKDYADGLITAASLDQYTTEQEVKDIVDAVIVNAVDGDTLTGLSNLVEYLNTHGSEAKEMAAAIDVLEGKVETIEDKPAYGITATQISNWDNEVGAKALAETKLDASTFTEYSNAHASDYTNKQIDDAIDADVKAAIDAEVLRANGAYDAKGAAAAAQAAAEATAAGALATARTEISAEIDADVKALADNVYTKANVYTKSEIDALLTWGEF